jgi:CSLREA domain-containing protein
MMLMTWHRALAQRAKTFRRGFALKRRRRSFRPMVEVLEDRRLLATLTVTTTADDLMPGDGSVSLREAITAINAGNDLGDPNITAQSPGTFGVSDTIQFGIGTGVQTIFVGVGGLPTITNSVWIQGDSTAGQTIVLDGSSSFFGNGLTVNARGVTISGLVIDNFQGDGIKLLSDGNSITGNFIGTDPTGTSAAPNVGEGIAVFGSNNTIGGFGSPALHAGHGNLISDNVEDSFGGGGNGILISSSFSGGNNNLVLGNFIGTDINGVPTLGNSQNGVEIDSGSGNTIGTGNLIAGNGTGIQASSSGPGTIGLLKGDGVFLNFASNNVVDNNSIFQNAENGVEDISGSSNTISNNNISGNGNPLRFAIGDGVSFANTSNDTVAGNSIVANTNDGVRLAISGSNGISGNTISANGTTFGDGVHIDRGAQNTVSGNTITSNTDNGVEIDDGFVFIGNSFSPTGFNLVSGNTISDNGSGTSSFFGGDDGILIVDTSQFGSFNSVQGNLIENNIANGVEIIGDDNNNVSNNTIDSNGSAGVAIGFNPSNNSGFPDTAARGNVILGNSIFNNGTLGIDLNSDGVPTPTDPNADPTLFSGPNDLLPYPQLISATNDGITATVSGILHSFANSSLTLEFFANTVANPSGSGEGETPLGTMDVTTDASGNASFTFSFSPVAGEHFITATATLLQASAVGLTSGLAALSTQVISIQPSLAAFETSEFSNAIPLPPPPSRTPPGDTTTITIISRQFVPPIPPVIPALPLPQSIALVIQVPPENPFELISQFFSRQPLAESPGEIHGRIWEDPTASGKKGGDTLPLEGQVVFIDANNNGVFDEGERFTVTNEKGEYSFTGLPAGTYTVLPLLGRGQYQTFNTARENKVELRSGAMVVDNVDIGIRQRATRKRRIADAIRYPSMERALALALDANALDGLNGPEGPMTAPEAAVPVPAAPVIAPAPAAQEKPANEPAWWQALLAAALIGPWCLLNALQASNPAERPDDEQDDESYG